MREKKPSMAPPRPLLRRPKFCPPPGAWDAHCHVFGPGDRFPYAEGRAYTPHDVPAERLLALHRALGFERAVLVQPAAHGTDHSALLNAISQSGGRYRGVMLVNGDGRDMDFAALHEAGIRGVRYNFLPHLGPPPDMRHVEAVARRIKSLGWHICLHTGPEQFEILGTWLELGVPVVLDHMGRIGAARGENQAAMLRRHLSHPRLFVKLSGIDRVSQIGAPFTDALPIAQQILADAPGQCLWGSDFPHPNHPAVPDDADLVDTIAEIARDAAMQHRLLVETPGRLYM